MFPNAATSTPAVPSRNALRVLRQLALAGSVGTFCTVAAITYDVHRRIRVAEQIIENKRTIRTSAPNYDATASAKRLAAMMEAAEAGEFMGLESMKHRPEPQNQGVPLEPIPNRGPLDGNDADNRVFPPLPRMHDSEVEWKFTPQNSYVDPLSQHDNRVALNRETEDDNARRTRGEPTLEELVRGYLRQGKAPEAAFAYLKRVDSFKEGGNKHESISWARRALGHEVFIKNCKAGNVFIARSIYTRIDKVSVVDTEMWCAMITLLAKHGHVESAAAVYQSKCLQFKLPDYLLEVTVRCLLESNRLSHAKWLFYSQIESDREGGLCGLYLDGLWKKSRSLELVVKEFRKVMKKLRDLERLPTEKVFNALIKSYIEAGQYEDAEATVRDMEHTSHVKPGCRTLGLLVHSRALQCDWVGVMDGLRKMREEGFTQGRERHNFNRAFDRIWIEYWPSHSSSDVWNFLQACIDEFNIKPDAVLHRHILEGLVERCDREIIQQFNYIADERRWNTGLDKDTIMRILKERRVAMQDTPAGFWNMMQAAKKQYGKVAMSKRIMGVGHAYYSIDNSSTGSIRHDAKKSFAGSLDRLKEKSSINLYVPFTKRMEHYIHSGRYLEVDEMFKQSLGKGYPSKPLNVQLAVIATLLHGGLSNLAHAKSLIQESLLSWNEGGSFVSPARRGAARFTPIFLQTIMQTKHNASGGVSDTSLMKLALFEFYNICAENDRLNFKHHASTSVARRMVSLRRPLIAVELLVAVYMSKWRQIYGFNQIQFKMLLRAWTYTSNARGIWWCMMSVLSHPEAVHHDFLVEVERLMPLIESKFSPSSVQQIQTLLHALQEKSAGARLKYWDRFTVDPELKKQKRAQPSVSPVENEPSSNQSQCPSSESSPPGTQELPTTPLEEALVAFDEEMELEHLRGRTQLDEKELSQWWAEHKISYLSHRQPEHPKYPEWSKVYDMPMPNGAKKGDTRQKQRTEEQPQGQPQSLEV